MQFDRVMYRREFITLLGGAAAAWPLAARAQQPERIRRVGVLMLYAENDPIGEGRAAVFRQSLEKLGWTIGRNLHIDYKWGLGDGDWLRAAATELLQRAPDVILANGGALRPVQEASRAVSIVFIGGGDPVADGFVQSLAKPGGNSTGFTVLQSTIGAKPMELLKEVAPRLVRVAVLINPDSPSSRHLAEIGGGCGATVHGSGCRCPGSRPRGDRSGADTIGRRSRRRFDRAPGPDHEYASRADHRFGSALSTARQSTRCARRLPRAV